MATTSAAAIRNNMAEVMQTLTPAARSDVKYRLTETVRADFRAHAEAEPDRVFREFEINIGAAVPTTAEDYTQQMRETAFQLIVAYPHEWALYHTSTAAGATDIYRNKGAMMFVMESDQKVIANGIGRRGGTNYVDGQLAAVEQGWDFEYGDNVSFLVMDLLVTHYHDVS